jgi:hypothetical protein
LQSKLKRVPEHQVYLALLALLAAIYLWAAFLCGRQDLWGFSQLRRVAPTTVLLSFAACAAAFSDLWWSGADGRARAEQTPTISRRRLLCYGLVAGAFVALFWLFRSQFLNPDGRLLTVKIPRDVPLRGAHVKHDEMLELYLHSRFWYYTNGRLGWSVVKSYQVLSVLAGGAAVFLLLVLSRLLQPRHSLTLFCLIISGGFMQLFFGDVENYTLMSALVVLYLLLAHFFLNGKVSLVIPSAALAVAICFHAGAGWLLPSLLYLYVRALRRRHYGAVAAALATSVFIVVGTLAAFHFSGLLPIRGLLSSHMLGDGRGFAGMLAPLSLEYYWQLLNLLFLLFPSILVFVPLIAYGRMDRSPWGVFLCIAAASMLVYMAVWRAGLGVYYDWNLFAPGIIPLALLCFHNLLRNEKLAHARLIWLGVLALSMLHSYSWIISNHSFQP